MKTGIKMTLALTLATVSALTRAEWTEITRFEDNTRIYVDNKTVRRDGDIAQVLHLVRWGEPQADPGQPSYLSTVVRTAYDCANKKERYLASTSYAGSMGNGATIIADQDDSATWDSISNDSMEEKLWKAACGVD